MEYSRYEHKHGKAQTGAAAFSEYLPLSFLVFRPLCPALSPRNRLVKHILTSPATDPMIESKLKALMFAH
jgi:hypothetical protein